jgi:hypothetical protein
MTEKNESAFNDEQKARVEAAQEARILLNQSGFTFSGGPKEAEPIITLAEWILDGSTGTRPSITVNVTAVGVEPEDFEDKDDEGPSDDELPKTYWCPACGKEHSIEKLPKGMQRLLADLMGGDDHDGR